MGMRENFFAVEILGCVLALTGDMPAAARAFAMSETQHVRGGMRWPILATASRTSSTPSPPLSAGPTWSRPAPTPHL